MLGLVSQKCLGAWPRWLPSGKTRLEGLWTHILDVVKPHNKTISPVYIVALIHSTQLENKYFFWLIFTEQVWVLSVPKVRDFKWETLTSETGAWGGWIYKHRRFLGNFISYQNQNYRSESDQKHKQAGESDKTTVIHVNKASREFCITKWNKSRQREITHMRNHRSD